MQLAVYSETTNLTHFKVRKFDSNFGNSSRTSLRNSELHRGPSELRNQLQAPGGKIVENYN